MPFCGKFLSSETAGLLHVTILFKLGEEFKYILLETLLEVQFLEGLFFVFILVHAQGFFAKTPVKSHGIADSCKW